ncbi:MAG: ParB/RepB/Spo0J family partition protein [Epsilonproteobacteria bacterium]|nr:ParB/RepB/Spo0J family partition protein [Campylobacterota bacterium]
MAYESELGVVSNRDRVFDIDIDRISPNPYQPRKFFSDEALMELGESIKRHGLLQPVVVVRNANAYILVTGERRLRAHKLIGLATIKSIVVNIDFDSIKLRELALVENIQRENLNPIELANSYQELIKEHGITHEELSQILHKSRSQITNTMRLLSLSRYVQDKVSSRELSQGHAKMLVGLSLSEQEDIANSIISQDLSVREAENLIKLKKGSLYQSSLEESQKLIEYGNDFKELLPFKFKFKKNSLEINFKDVEEIEKFIIMIKKSDI